MQITGSPRNSKHPVAIPHALGAPRLHQSLVKFAMNSWDLGHLELGSGQSWG